MELLLAIVGGGFLFWLFFMRAPKRHERTVSWRHLESELEDLLRVDGPSTRNGDEATRVHVDLEQMTVEYWTLLGGHQNTSEWLLRRSDAGKWEKKAHLETDEDAGEDPEIRSTTDALADFYGLGTPEWDPTQAPAYEKQLAKLKDWQPLEENLAVLAEDRHRRLLQVLQAHPGVYPGMTEEVFISSKYDRTRRWLPPVHE